MPNAPVNTDRRPRSFGLLQLRECLVPTLRGWLVLLLICGTMAVIAVRSAYFFFAVTDPVPGGLLVVEGWCSDVFLSNAIEEFRRNQYAGLFVTGGPLEKGTPFAEYGTYAELTAKTLEQMGFDPKVLHAVPARAVQKDRTCASALALKTWLRQHEMRADQINILTVGVHARRTRLLFEKAFGSGTRIGIVSMEEETFDPNHWWRSSQGFRAVMDEAIAYFYARFLFRPASE